MLSIRNSILRFKEVKYKEIEKNNMPTLIKRKLQ